MKWFTHRVKRILIITGSILFLVVALTVLFISPLTKYLAEKYDVEFTGREITLDWVYVNPFTGYAHFSGLKLYEAGSDSIFFSADGISANLSLMKILSGTYEISSLDLDHPHGTVLQNKKIFNFDDLIKKFVPKDKDTTGEPVHVNILDLKIKNGEFYYRETDIPVNYFIREVNIESPGMRWDVDTVTTEFSFLSGPGTGEIKGRSTINLKNMDFRIGVVVKKFDLSVLEQYIREMAAYGTLRANLDADFYATGNLQNQENVDSHGQITINDLHFGKNPQEDYTSFKKLTVAIRQLSPIKHIYRYDSLSLESPYFKYEKYDKLDNLQNMFGKNGENIKEEAANKDHFNLVIEIAEYMKVLFKNFFKSEYHINRMAIYNADLRYNDFSISEKFSAALDPLTFIADSIDRKKDKVGIVLRSAIKPHGDLLVRISVNPKDSTDFDLGYHFDNIPSAMFNPYVATFTSYKLDRGSIELKGDWHVRNGNIKSNNHLVVVDPRTSKRVRNKDTKWIPMPLVMSIVRERGNVIDYQVPITGDLKDPNFHLRDVVFDLLGNIFIKPPTTPYRMEVKNIETKIEKSLIVNWQMRQTRLQADQEKFIEDIAEFLANEPSAVIDIHPINYTEKEKEHILLFEGKKKYFRHLHGKKGQNISEDDSTWIDRLSIKDAGFIKFLDEQVNDSLVFTVQEKCTRILGEGTIEKQFDALIALRKEAILAPFRKKNVTERIKVHKATRETPFNGFSYFKIDYNGTFPKDLLAAYEKLDELNQESPRKEYKKERSKRRKSGADPTTPLVSKAP